MTKVYLTQSILDYRREMRQAVSRTIKARFIEGLKTFPSAEPAWVDQEFLPPPRIETIEPTCYNGKIEDPIFLITSADLGVANLYVVIRDDQGNVIESGNATPFEDCPDYWDYLATVSVPSGTRVTIYAAATDTYWGVGAACQVVTIP